MPDSESGSIRKDWSMEKDSNLHSTLIGRVSLPLDDPWIDAVGPGIEPGYSCLTGRR
jgi:hypothetical protein